MSSGKIRFKPTATGDFKKMVRVLTGTSPAYNNYSCEATGTGY